MPPEDYRKLTINNNYPAGSAVAIAQNDTDDLEVVNRGIYIGVGGDVKVVMAENGEIVTFKNAQAGSTIPYSVTRVFDNGTTAANLLAVW